MDIYRRRLAEEGRVTEAEAAEVSDFVTRTLEESFALSKQPQKAEEAEEAEQTWIGHDKWKEIRYGFLKDTSGSKIVYDMEFSFFFF